MRAAGSVQGFLRAPRGAWLATRCFLVWNQGPRLGGATVWGTPREPDVELFFVLTDAYHRQAPGCDVVTDTSAVESVDDTSYRGFVEGMRARAGAFAANVRKHALVRPAGLLGGLAEGLLPLAGLRHTWRVFAGATEAFAWLDQPDGNQVMNEVARLVQEARGVPPGLQALRSYLRAHLRGARLPDAAVALGMSERTLHRVLREAGTGFRDELATARVDSARELLAGTDLKIAEVARRVGCASHAHLTTLFKRRTGQSPTAFRGAAERPP